MSDDEGAETAEGDGNVVEADFEVLDSEDE